MNQNIDLDKFMAPIFGRLKPNEGVPIITALDACGRMGQRYKPGRNPCGEQIYFCISTVRDVPHVRLLGRKTVDLVRSCVIPLDDIGTKIDPTKIVLEPSCALETSPGNHQLFYFLERPISPGVAASILNGLANAGLTDKGAIGASRVMRVPGSLNVKRGDGFRARVVSWNPERSFSPPQLAKGLGFAYGPSRKAPTPRPPLQIGEHDPYLVALERLGMVQGAASGSSGFISVSCPWEDEHSTPPLDRGAGYVPALGGGAFHCFHGSCRETHGTFEFKRWLDRKSKEAK